MNSWKRVVFTLCLTLLAMAITPGVKADAQNKLTKVSFSQPVEIPGVGAQVLPAGIYVFKLLDSQSDRHIVQILNESQSHVFATILAIPNFRLQSTDKTVMTFRERAAGTPEALRAWFYPGNNWGQEFVYPKRRALELAKITNEPVLAMPAELATNITVPVQSADEAPVIALKEATVTAVKPTGEEVAVFEVVERPPVVEPVERTPVQTAAAIDPQPTKRLPATASPLPLLALLGLLSLGAGILLSVVRKRSS